MFGCKHYVPVLRYKEAERAALHALFPADRAFVTPLVEVPPKAFGPRWNGKKRRLEKRNPRTVLESIAANIATCWGRQALFLDLMLLKPAFRVEKELPWSILTKAVTTRRLPIIPVTGIREDDQHRNAIRHLSKLHGACIRLRPLDLERQDLHDRLRSLLVDLHLKPERTDLVVDLEEFYEGAPSYSEICERLPVIERWRTFTLLSGAFLPDLRDIKAGDTRELRRCDLLRWLEQSLHSDALRRQPSFGDYTVQFARYVSTGLKLHKNTGENCTLGGDSAPIGGLMARGRLCGEKWLSYLP